MASTERLTLDGGEKERMGKVNLCGNVAPVLTGDQACLGRQCWASLVKQRRAIPPVAARFAYPFDVDIAPDFAP